MSVQKRADVLRACEGAFFGRASAFQQLGALFDGGARLAVIVGLGGIGKTRLAAEYVALRAARWSGGVWVCDLSNATSLGELCEVVARGLGVEQAGVRLREDRGAASGI